MRNQEYRERIEKVAVSVEQQQKGVIKQKNAILKEIENALKETGKENLIQQLDQIQYFVDDAMYIAIYQAAIEDAIIDEKNKIKNEFAFALVGSHSSAI